MSVMKFDGSNFEKEVLQSNEPVLVDFWAAWCGPCKAVGPVVEELANAYDGKLKVGKLNVDENRDLAGKYGIQGIPTLAIFKNGAEAERTVGFQGKQHLQKFIDANL